MGPWYCVGHRIGSFAVPLSMPNSLFVDCCKLCLSSSSATLSSFSLAIMSSSHDVFFFSSNGRWVFRSTRIGIPQSIFTVHDLSRVSLASYPSYCHWNLSPYPRGPLHPSSQAHPDWVEIDVPNLCHRLTETIFPQISPTRQFPSTWSRQPRP